ncbi:MAG: hypothetical protein EP338_11185 [Bacteroidetes bacterium]|nr:MAG: hypothetical protein EP338_11185 [Bacteroidota bacterium]
MTRTKSYITLFLFVHAFFTHVGAQQQYTWNQFRLSADFVYDISQDHKSRLLISTEKGFYRYDGRKLKKFTESTGLLNDFCYSQVTLSNGDVWIGHFQNGISILHNNGLVEAFKSKVFENKSILKLIHPSPEYVLALCNDQKLFTINLNTRHVELTEEGVYDLLNGPKELILATTKGLLQVKWEKNKLIRHQEISRASYYLLSQNSNGFIASSESEKFAIYEWNGESCRLKQEINIRGGQHPSFEMKKILSVKPNTLAVITENDGLWFLNYANPRKLNWFKDIQEDKDLLLQEIYADQEGNLWVGSLGKGLFRGIKKDMNQLQFEEGVTALCRLDSNRVVLGTKKGLRIFDVVANKKTLHKLHRKLQSYEISALLSTKKSIWIGTRENGIYRFDRNTGSLEAFSSKNHLDFQEVTCISKNEKKIYIGTLQGLYVIDRRNFRVETLSTDNGLPHNEVRSLYFGSKEDLWIGFRGLGPCRYRDGKFNLYKEIRGLNSYHINAIHEHAPCGIWLGTFGDGLFHFNGKKFTQITEQDGLLSDFIYSVLVASETQLFVGHKTGVSILRMTENSYGTSVYPGVVCDHNAILSFPGKGVLVGTESGLIQFNLQNDFPKPKDCNTVFSRIALNGKELKQTERIELPYGSYSLKFEFSRVRFSRKSRIRYKYILKGLEHEWHQELDQTEISYPKLTEGNYTFLVYSADSKGNWDPKPATFHVSIDQPTWKKTWFIILMLLAVISVIWLIFQWRMSYLLEIRKTLRKEVANKTKELRKEKSLVEKQNKSIKSSINYALRIQSALLPQSKEISMSGLEYFILYLPKDIVSGDFYWFHENTNDYFIAAADCTGHGVPGAFVSMISTLSLNHIMERNPEAKPAEILEELDKQIVRSLKQHDEHAPMDGLEIGLLQIDKDLKNAAFAGARRPLIQVSGSDLKIHKASLHGIAGYNYGNEKVFECQRIRLNPNDELYMYSDGFPDQFGGTEQNKFSTDRLHQILVDKTIPFVEKKSFLEEQFVNWKGANKQLDDILIVGIKIND